MSAAGGAETRSKVLLVDDDASVLQALVRQLRTRFDVGVATSGMDGLRAIATAGPFAVIVSDMGMPRMDGPSFLSRARQAAPDATRILLTGQTDFEMATEAVNRGNIFRLLFKPCAPEMLIEAIDAGVVQHRLVISERVLLEQTLQGLGRALVETLALACPAAFGRSQRVKRIVLEMERRVSPRRSWAVELAATVSQLGTLSLPVSVIEQACMGEPLSPEEQQMMARVPEVTERLLMGIPRLDPVLDILRGQVRTWLGPAEAPHGDQIPLGAQLLRIASDYDTLEAQGLHSALAVGVMRSRAGVYDPALLETLADVALGTQEQGPEVREVGVSALRLGMVLAADLKSMSGVLLLARGTEISEPVLRWVTNYNRSELRLPIRVVLPPLDETGRAGEAAPAVNKGASQVIQPLKSTG